MSRYSVVTMSSRSVFELSRDVINVNRWLGITNEVIASSITFAAAAFAVVQRDVIGAGLAGLSVSYALQVCRTPSHRKK